MSIFFGSKGESTTIKLNVNIYLVPITEINRVTEKPMLKLETSIKFLKEI